MTSSTSSISTTHRPAANPSEEWMIRADLADLAKTSEDTICRDVKKHDLETKADDAGRVLVKVSDFVRIGRITARDLAVAGNDATPREAAEVVRARGAISDLQIQLARAEGRLENAAVAVDDLRKQLDMKDRQLKAREAEAASTVQTIMRLTSMLATLGGAA